LKLKWRQSSTDRKIRMVKKEEAAVNKNGKGQGREQSAQDQLMLSLRGLARAALWDTVVISGLAFVEEEMEAERAALCGPRRTSGRAPGAALWARGELAGDGRPASES
jgi:hypothetical protein